MTTIEVKKQKDIGLGSLSFRSYVYWEYCLRFEFGDKSCMGDHILHTIGLSAWSNGDSGIHYTVFYSAIFFIPPLLLVIYILIIEEQKQRKSYQASYQFLSFSALITLIISYLSASGTMRPIMPRPHTPHFRASSHSTYPFTKNPIVSELVLS